jgi:cellulose synthase/poly-beta-1,6-N-acetylglucosamine synthase-like glycosyltransferase
VTVIIPAYNEERVIEASVHRILASDLSGTRRDRRRRWLEGPHQRHRRAAFGQTRACG